MTPAPFTVSFHDTVSGTAEQDFVFGANARTLFENLKTIPTVVDVQFFANGEMIEDWTR